MTGRYTFEPLRPDGSPRKMVGMHRPSRDTMERMVGARNDGGFYMPTYHVPQFETAIQQGRFDRPIYEDDDPPSGLGPLVALGAAIAGLMLLIRRYG